MPIDKLMYRVAVSPELRNLADAWLAKQNIPANNPRLTYWYADPPLPCGYNYVLIIAFTPDNNGNRHRRLYVLGVSDNQCSLDYLYYVPDKSGDLVAMALLGYEHYCMPGNQGWTTSAGYRDFRNDYQLYLPDGTAMGCLP